MYCLTLQALKRSHTKLAASKLFWTFALLLVSPAAAYAAYYSRLLGEPIWLYRLRALPGSELLAAFAGVVAALLHYQLIPRLNLSAAGRKTVIPALLVLGLLLPYLKPVLRPLKMESLSETWTDGVCQQSSAATCGPASVATILAGLGIKVTERELAGESFSSASGTENWYLARAVRRRGLHVEFLVSDPSKVPLPAVAGVNLPSANGAGHFIALLGRTNDMLVFADPLEGRQTATPKELAAKYHFTGFFLGIKPANTRWQR